MSEEHPEMRPVDPRPPENGDTSYPAGDAYLATQNEPASYPATGGVPAAQFPVAEQSAARGMSGRRPQWWLVAVLLVVALGAGFGVGAWVWAGPPGDDVLDAALYDRCTRQVFVYFKGSAPDGDMREAAAQLRDDPRIESVREQTRQETYERFKESFADEPALLERTRPEALPASITLVLSKGNTGTQLQGALQAKFPDAEVNTQTCPKPA